MILAVPLILGGLAVIHMAVRRHPARLFMLIGVYVVAFVSVWADRTDRRPRCGRAMARVAAAAGRRLGPGREVMVDVILLERVEHLGQMGQVVKVRPGYARNFLLPQKKALRATKDNLKYFESQRTQLEANNLKLKGEAAEVAAKLDGVAVVIIRQAGESGQLYGSVSAATWPTPSRRQASRSSAARSCSTIDQDAGPPPRQGDAAS